MFDSFLLWLLSMGVLGLWLCFFVWDWWSESENESEKELLFFTMRSYPFSSLSFSLVFPFRFVCFVCLKCISLWKHVETFPSREHGGDVFQSFCFFNCTFVFKALHLALCAFVLARRKYHFLIRIAWTWGCRWKFMLFLYREFTKTCLFFVLLFFVKAWLKLSFFIPSSCFRSDVVIFFKFSFLFLTWSWFGKRGVYDL